MNYLLQTGDKSLISLNNLTDDYFSDYREEFSEMDLSALKEVGNIIAASYVNAIAELTGLAIEISPPELSVDMVGSVLSLPAIYYANISDKIIFIKDELDKEDAASSQIILIPDVDSLKKIMESLGLADI